MIAKAKEDAKVAREAAKAAKKAAKMVMVGHSGAVTVGQGGRGGVATAEPATPMAEITISQQHHEFPDESTPWIPIEHLI